MTPETKVLPPLKRGWECRSKLLGLAKPPKDVDDLVCYHEYWPVNGTAYPYFHAAKAQALMEVEMYFAGLPEVLSSSILVYQTRGDLKGVAHFEALLKVAERALDLCREFKEKERK